MLWFFSVISLFLCLLDNVKPQINIGYQPNRPFYAPNPSNYPTQLIPPGKPWPASAAGYNDNNMQTTTTQLTTAISSTPNLIDRIQEIINNSGRPTQGINKPPPAIVDRVQEIQNNGGGRPTFHPNPGDYIGEIVPPGKPWPANAEDYANFSQSIPTRLPPDQATSTRPPPLIIDRDRETTTIVNRVQNVQNNGGGRPPFHPNPGDLIAPIVPPGKPWPANAEDYTSTTQSNLNPIALADRNKVPVGNTGNNLNKNPFFQSTGDLISQIVPPGKPWPANPEDYTNFTQTTRPPTRRTTTQSRRQTTTPPKSQITTASSTRQTTTLPTSQITTTKSITKTEMGSTPQFETTSEIPSTLGPPIDINGANLFTSVALKATAAPFQIPEMPSLLKEIPSKITTTTTTVITTPAPTITVPEKPKQIAAGFSAELPASIRLGQRTTEAPTLKTTKQSKRQNPISAVPSGIRLGQRITEEPNQTPTDLPIIRIGELTTQVPLTTKKVRTTTKIPETSTTAIPQPKPSRIQPTELPKLQPTKTQIEVITDEPKSKIPTTTVEIIPVKVQEILTSTSADVPQFPNVNRELYSMMMAPSINQQVQFQPPKRSGYISRPFFDIHFWKMYGYPQYTYKPKPTVQNAMRQPETIQQNLGASNLLLPDSAAVLQQDRRRITSRNDEWDPFYTGVPQFYPNFW